MSTRIAPLSFHQTVRRLRQHPSQALACVLIFGLGLGLTTASESILYGLYYRPLPLPGAHRLVRVEEVKRDQAGLSATRYDDFRDWSEGQAAFDELVGWYPVGVAARVTGGGTERYSTAYATPNLFRALGVHPLLGRPFEPRDAASGSAPVAIIGDGLWRSAFGGDPHAIGQLLWVHGKPFTVVGVMPPGFSFPFAQKLWVPLTPETQREMTGLPLQVFGRLKPGASAASAAAQLEAILSRGSRRGGGDRAGLRILVSPYAARYVKADLRSAHLRMLLGVFGLLLIACANVASLLLARSIPRTIEFATRAALGASRRRLFGETLVEPLLLAGGGAALALLIALSITQTYARYHEPTRLAWEVVRIDAQSLAFVLAAGVASALLAGILPALLAAQSRDLHATLQEASPGARGRRLGRLLSWLLAVQVTLSCGLLIGMGLTLKSLANVLSIEVGFPTDHLLTAALSVYRTERLGETEGNRLMREIAERAAGLPGIRAVALADTQPVPDPGEAEPQRFTPDTLDRSAPKAGERLAFVQTVAPGYFDAVRLRVVAGRAFMPLDDEHGPRVVIVTESLSRRFFGGATAVGHRLRFTKGWYEIVGVVSDSLLGGIGSDPHSPGVYLSLLQYPSFCATYCQLITQTSGPPLQALAELKKTVARVNPDGNLFDVQPLDERLAAASQTYRVAGLLFLILGGSAFTIVMAGIYGVAAFSAANRRFEVSVRLAMGAQARQILYLLVSRVAVPWLSGLPLARSSRSPSPAISAPCCSRSRAGILPSSGWSSPASCSLVSSRASPRHAAPSTSPRRRF